MDVIDSNSSSYHHGIMASHLQPSSETITTTEESVLSEGEGSVGDDEQGLISSKHFLAKYKRSNDEVFSDSDFYPLKKRRKQSKPVRISSNILGCNERDSEDEDNNREEIESQNKYESDDVVDGRTREPIIKETRLSVSNELDFICTSCNEHFNEQKDLQFHINTRHLKNKSITQEHGESKNDFPLNLSNVHDSDAILNIRNITSPWITNGENKVNEKEIGTNYTEAFQQFHPHNVFSDGSISGSNFIHPNSNFLLPLLPHGSGHSLPSRPQSSISTSIRIFNPDAFCHLCNKEFCNKYFLKTHKANKHGIYMDTVISSSYSSPTNTIVTSLPTLPSRSSPFVSPKNNESSSSLKYSGNVTMRAFCDICHKRFCNKYFVRRHKAKIHGIADESPINSSYLSLPDYVRKSDGEEQGSISAGSDTGSNIFDPGLSENSEQKDKDENVRQNLSYEADNIGFPANIKQESDTEHEDQKNCYANVVTSDNKLSPNPRVPKDTSISTDHLRKLGVINADAFCEICCKEYCNKYFLRTHKMKRHGILIPDNENKDFKPFGLNSGPWVNMQTSPLNLIIGEHTSDTSDATEKTKSDLFDVDDHQCNICGCKFQNAQLMQMHRAYFHTDTAEDDSYNRNASNFGDCTETSERDVPSCDRGDLHSNETQETTASNNNEETNEISPSESLNYDLQKLQTMIIQLNDLTVSQIKTCTMCNKDFQTTNHLREHMVNDHGAVMEKCRILTNDDINTANDYSDSKSELQLMCYICKKEFISHDLLNAHVEEHHAYSSTTNAQIDSVKNEVDSKEFVDKSVCNQLQQNNSDKRVSLTPTSSYCEICNKELCNKYFMKTHMQRMHGIEIENGAQIGGVICDICNKELCSKYFLRVHKQNTHGIIDDASTSQPGRESSTGNSNGNFQPENDYALKPSDIGDLNHRYFTHFTEVCPICNRRFRSTKWLKAHLLSDHGECGIEKWNEFEMQHQNQTQQSKSPQQTKTLLPLPQTLPVSGSPTLKIPSNWQSQYHERQCQPARGQVSAERYDEHGSSQVLTNLLGSTHSSTKNYRCSYCPFSTQILAFLFVHEKSHTGLSSQQMDSSKSLQCPVCFQNFQQTEKFQHHFLTHQFSGLLHPLFSPSNTPMYSPPLESSHYAHKIAHHSLPKVEINNGIKIDATDIGMKVEATDNDLSQNTSTTQEEAIEFRCKYCLKRFQSQDLCAEHIKSEHSQDGRDSSEQVSLRPSANVVAQEKRFKCAHCNFSSIHILVLKKHIRREHKTETSEDKVKNREDAGRHVDDVKKRLEDAVQKSKLPASYAVPQAQSTCIDGFVMQPFLLEEPNRKFVPSLVFLPVKEKMSEPLTVSFMLTPA